MSDQVILTLKRDGASASVEGTRVSFSPHQCFAFDGGSEDIACLKALGDHLMAQPGLGIYGMGRLFEYLLEHVPELKSHIRAVVVDAAGSDTRKVRGIPTCTPDDLPNEVCTVFLCETLTFPRMQMRKRLPQTVNVIEPNVLVDMAFGVLPARAWTPTVKHIYPIDVPEIEFKKGMDLILIDCPARNLALMPNGLGYAHNALKKTSIKFQTFDLDIVAYHRFHIRRLLDEGGKIVLPSGKELPVDPWQAEHYDIWVDPEVIEYLSPIIDEAAAALIEARPKILGLSLQQCNEAFSRPLVKKIKAALPDTVILVGGFSCYIADIGRRAFPECDYMCVGEADLTVGPLVEALARGERPANQPGVLSRYDTRDYNFIPAPMPHDLSKLEPPKYEWFNLDVYRNYNDYQLTPIIASRGCRWSRCTFCAERFYWRIRDTQEFVDELEWLVQQGCTLFMFNESDLNGMPEKVLEICDEIIRRELNIKLTGQLRIHKKSDRAFYDKLHQAGFVALRFGVDAFSENALRLQKKGYTIEMISQNLKDCWEAGIYTEVNWVIGVPGETDADVEEGIQLILKNQKYIGRLANINPLILVNGGVYWIDPEAHNVKFRAPKEELYEKYPRAIPADLWYSTDPYIDAQVRKDRFEQIVMTLHEHGFPVGAWATRIIEDVKYARDRNRAGGTTVSESDRARAGTTSAGERAEAAEPRLVRTLATHKIVYYDSWYYALPHALGKVDVTNQDVSQFKGVVKDTAEAAVLAEIEHASKWANSRGHYDAQERQRAAGSYMRVDSALSEEKAAELASKPKILRYDGEFFAVDREALDDAFSVQGLGLPYSLLRRVAGKLPEPVKAEMRRILRVQQYRSGKPADGKTAEVEIASMIARGFVDEYVVGPVGRLFGEHSKPRIGKPIEVAVPGEDFTLVRAVTKGATAELMRTIGNYNLVRFDGMYYGVPHGSAVDWEKGEVPFLPGVFVGESAKEVTESVQRATGRSTVGRREDAAGDRITGPAGEISNVPKLLGSLEGYNIVTYEGWVYGIPQSLGEINLAEVDAMEMPAVVRDVSQDVVEGEILDRVSTSQATAAE